MDVLIITGVQASIVYCDSAVSYGLKLYVWIYGCMYVYIQVFVSLSPVQEYMYIANPVQYLFI